MAYKASTSQHLMVNSQLFTLIFMRIFCHQVQWCWWVHLSGGQRCIKIEWQQQVTDFYLPHRRLWESPHKWSSISCGRA